MTESKQARYDQYFMDIAERTAAMSYAEKRKVGCVIVRDNHIIAAGWNGQPAHMDNCCEYRDENGELKTKDTVIHAEANALYWCAKTEIITDGATCYTTLSPCKHCALGLIQSGVKRVVYKELYWNGEKTGLDLLQQAGVLVEQIGQGSQYDVTYIPYVPICHIASNTSGNQQKTPGGAHTKYKVSDGATALGYAVLDIDEYRQLGKDRIDSDRDSEWQCPTCKYRVKNLQRLQTKDGNPCWGCRRFCDTLDASYFGGKACKMYEQGNSGYTWF